MQVDLLNLLRDYQADDPAEQMFLQQTRDFVADHRDCCSRGNIQGHITASAWVLAPDRQAVLLTHHKKLQRWLQLGGHVEDDLSIQAAALREAREESGLHHLVFLSSQLFDLDVHLIPARLTESPHYHYDLRFILQAEQSQFTLSDESDQLAWVSLSRLQALVAAQKLDASIARMLKKTLRQWL